MSSPSTMPGKQNGLPWCLILVGIGMVALMAATIAVVLLVGTTLLFALQTSPTRTATASIAASGRMKGNPTAPIAFSV